MKKTVILLLVVILLSCVNLVGCIPQEDARPIESNSAVAEEVKEEQQSTEQNTGHINQGITESAEVKENTESVEATEETNLTQTEATQPIPEETIPDNTENHNKSGNGTMLPDDEF